MTQGLILVDIQNDYFPDGKMELFQMKKAAQNAGLVLAHFRKTELPIFFIQHLSNYPGAVFFVPDTDGAKIHESIAPQNGEAIITKHFPNAFRETDLLASLNHLNIKEIVICGAMSHMCIDATTRAGFDLGFQCSVIADACTTRDLEFNGVKIEAQMVHGSFMAALSSPYAKVISTTEFIG